MSAAVKPEFYLYNLTLQRSSSAIQCCIGNFTGAKHQQQIVRCTQTALELWTFNRRTGALTKVLEQYAYSNLRNISAFRPSGFDKDYLIVTSDSGDLCILELDKESFKFGKVVDLPYTKTGIRAITPGEFIALDGQSRAFLLGAILKNKCACSIIRDEANKPSISSLLEANNSGTVTFAMCGLDVGFEDPLFAAIESCTSSQSAKKSLTYYELDLGLNYVVKKYTEDAPKSANFLLSIPGGIYGPSGVLMCSKGLIQYKYLTKMTHNIPIPRRGNQKEDAQVIAGVVHVLKHDYFILLQTDLGDLFKVTVTGKKQDSDESDGQAGMVDKIEIRYFDSMPICTSLLVFRSGFLYANCESGDQYIYQFEKLGDEPGEKVWCSTDFPDEIAAKTSKDAVFQPRKFVNLNLVYIVENMNPVIDATIHSSDKVTDLPVIISLCGSQSRSSLKILNHEIPYTEIVSQELPSNVQAVFAVSTHADDANDKLIALSFYDETLVLQVGEEVEEAENSGFRTDVATLQAAQLGNNSVVQVFADGLRQIFYDDDDKPVDTVKWEVPVGIEVLHSAVTETQVVLALSSREIAYFEVDEQDRLIEYGERKELGSQITSLCLGELSGGRKRFPFIFAGGKDQTLTILKTDPSATLEMLSKQDLSSIPTSLVAFPMKNPSAFVYSDPGEESDEESNGSGVQDSLFLHIGMANGVYARLKLDPVTGEMSNPRNQYVGPQRVHLSKLVVGHQNVVGINSVRTYLGYTTTTEFRITALSKPAFNDVCTFKSEDVSNNGVLAVDGNTLFILTVDQLDSSLLIESIPLRYTPRAMADTIKQNGMVYIGEADSGIVSTYVEQAEKLSDSDELVLFETDDEKDEYYQQFGYQHKSSEWSSCIQVISFENKAVGQTIELLNEAAFKMCSLTFSSEPQYTFLAVSTSVNQRFAPNQNEAAYLRIYKVEADGSLSLYYKTKTEALAMAVTSFKGMLLAGIGNTLVLYTLGKRQLLKKSAIKLDCRIIVDVKSVGSNIFVSDVNDSVRFVTYKPLVSSFFVVSDDCIQRHVTRALPLDERTVMVGDKFGELSVLRCGDDAWSATQEDPHGTFISGMKGKMNGAPFRMKNLMNFFIGDVPTSLGKGTLTVGGSECILYAGIQGTLGCLHPLRTVKEMNFFVELQKHVAKALEPITGREIMKFRSYYIPIKGCIDGDLLEEYLRMSWEKRQKIAKKMDREPREIDRRISDMRTRFAY